MCWPSGGRTGGVKSSDTSGPRSDRPGTGGQPIGGQSWGGVDQSEARDDGRCYPVVVTSVTTL